MSINSLDLINVKIELSKVADIEELANLGLTPDGYIIDNKYWVTNLSKQEKEQIKKTRFKYKLIKESEKSKIRKEATCFFKDLAVNFDNCGYQLKLTYNQLGKIDFVNIQIFDLRGNRVARKIGYNIPPDSYMCKFPSHNWSDGIYLIQLETNKKKKKIQ